VPPPLDDLCVNTLRFLAVDMVQKAASGHPGFPLGAACLAYALWDRALKHNPCDPHWSDRDRFVLSAGDGSSLLYALLHVTGYDLSLDDLKRFRAWGSRTPAQPEYGKTPGVEATTATLGQGFANAVGMAIAETALAARFNRPGHTIVDHRTYVLAGDGDLEDGISAEAGANAARLRLGKLVVLYADNRVTSAGGVPAAPPEDRVARFASLGWHVQRVETSNDVAAVTAALQSARDERARPSLIVVRTHLGFGSPHKQDTAVAYGEPLGAAEVRLTKARLGWPVRPAFLIPPEALAHFRQARARGDAAQAEWQLRFAAYAREYPEPAAEFSRVTARRRPPGWDAGLPSFRADDGPMATQAASGKTVAFLGSRLPEMLDALAATSPDKASIGPASHVGVRVHATGAILNGIALHGLIPYGGTYLLLSDYMCPPMCWAASNGLPVIYVFTHDAAAEDAIGRAAPPVAQLQGLRSIPGMVVIRPADANETVASWQIAIERERPVTLLLTRASLPVLEASRYPRVQSGVRFGGYVLADAKALPRPDVALIAAGSEVHLALAGRQRLAEQGIHARVVSMPSAEIFAEQSDAYRAEVLPPNVPLLAIEAGVTMGWRSYDGPRMSVLHIDKVESPVYNVCREAATLALRRAEQRA
jgi:transketolase